MTAIGGQALPSDEPMNEEAFRQIAQEIGVDPDTYIEALYRVPSMPEDKIHACADLLGMMIDDFVNEKYEEYCKRKTMETYEKNLEVINGVIERIRDNSKKLTKLASKEGILALNSAIEAARLGAAGASFSILAKQQSALSKQSGEIYDQIGSDIQIISEAISEMNRSTSEEKPVELEDLL